MVYCRAIRSHQWSGSQAQAHQARIDKFVFYQARTGCAWRLLPHDLPPWSTVYKRFETWRDDGIWDRLLEGLRRAVRVAAGRDPEPTAGAMDTQSIQTGGKRGAVSGTMPESKYLAVSAIRW